MEPIYNKFNLIAIFSNVCWSIVWVLKQSVIKLTSIIKKKTKT